MVEITVEGWIQCMLEYMQNFEPLESPVTSRDETVAMWIIRCLSDPNTAYSDVILEILQENRTRISQQHAV